MKKKNILKLLIFFVLINMSFINVYGEAVQQQEIGGGSSSNESESSKSGAYSQYKLQSSSENSCKYENSENNMSNEINIQYIDNDVRGNGCDYPGVTVCHAIINDSIKSRFINNETFSCPKYIYVSTSTVQNPSVGLINITLTVADTGGESDKDREEERVGSINTESTPSITGDYSQYKLQSSSTDACRYRNNENNMSNELNIQYIDNDVRGNGCTHPGINVCHAIVDENIKSKFIINGAFTCPEYIYVSTSPVEYPTVGIAKMTLTVADAGGESDKDRKSEEEEKKFNPETLCGSNNENCNIDITAFCNDNHIARTLKFLGLLLQIAKVLVPALIIVLGFIDLVKIITSGKVDEAKKQATNIFKRILIGAFIFLLPTILITIFNAVNSILNDSDYVTVDDGEVKLNVPTNLRNCVDCILDPKNCKFETTSNE